MIRGSEAAQARFHRMAQSPKGFKEDHQGLDVLQMEFIILLAKGMENDQIANKMKSSHSWVVNTKRKIMRTLNASNPVNLISICYQKGILKVGE